MYFFKAAREDKAWPRPQTGLLSLSDERASRMCIGPEHADSLVEAVKLAALGHRRMVVVET